MERESLRRSLAGGWTTLGSDPVRILLPTAGVVLLGVLEILTLREAWHHLDLQHLLGFAVVLHLARGLATVPLRAAVLATGARALGTPARGLPRAPALLVVVGTMAAFEGVLTAIAIFLPLTAAAYLLGRANFLLGTLALCLAALLATGVSLAVRTVLAYAPVEAVVGRRGGIRSLTEGYRAAREDWPRLLAIVALGDAVVSSGALLGGIGALPTWPWPHLAVLHRWIGRER